MLAIVRVRGDSSARSDARRETLAPMQLAGGALILAAAVAISKARAA